VALNSTSDHIDHFSFSKSTDLKIEFGLKRIIIITIVIASVGPIIIVSYQQQ